MILRVLLVALAGLAGGMAVAQTSNPLDASGNGMLQGDYRFRQVVYSSFNQWGDIGDAYALWGTMHFDGAGNYTVNGEAFVAGATAPQGFTTSGKYTISASGHGYIDSMLVDGESVIGLVSNGVFAGSSTESSYVNDLFVAVAAGTPDASAFQGKYWMASVDFPSAYADYARNGFFSAVANGAGGFTNNFSLTGYIGANGSSAAGQTIEGPSYSFANGVGTLRLPLGSTSATSALVSGDKEFYLSADGRFLVGGSRTAFDMIVGIRAGATAGAGPVRSGLYYSAGLAEDTTYLSQGYAQMSTYYGSLLASGTNVIRHQRLLPFDAASFDYTESAAVTQNSNGSAAESFLLYGAGEGGAGYVGIGKGPQLGLHVGVHAPDLSGGGVYLNPAGVFNAASFAPFTAGLARGEMLTLFGTNLARSTAGASTPFPTVVDGVQVLINQRPAPIVFVSPNQISCIVPYGTEVPSNVQIVVENNGERSNVVTGLMNSTAPGLFTQTQNGTGSSAALHADFTLVSQDLPARRGETILVYLTGMGDVTPAVADGAPGPSNPLSVATNSFTVYIGGRAATVSYAGLAPGFAGLYQLNVTVPDGLVSGDAAVAVSGPDFYTVQAIIPIE